MKKSAADVLELLRKRGEVGVTGLDALTAVGCWRLGARVWDLRAEGHVIESTLVTTPSGKRVARYVLRETTQLAAGF